MRANLSSNMPIIILSIIIIFCGTFSSYYSTESLSAIAQMHPNGTQQSPAQQLTEPMGVKISSPLSGQKVPVGELNISGTSTDNAAKDCSVLVDVNDIKPLQKTDAVGPGGQNDYSSWSFTYTENYHLITEGPNELTAKLACNENLENTNGSSSIPVSNTSNGKSKWYSINVTGIAVPSADEGDQNKTQSETQFANASKQNASVSESPQHTTSDHAGIATLSDSVQEKKIADLDEEELSQPDTESSSPRELQSEQAEDLDRPNIPETSRHQIEESDDMIQYPSSDLITDDSLTYAEEQQPNELDNQDNLQQPMPMSDLPSENNGGDQFIEEIQGTDIDGADYSLSPDEDELPAELTEPPLQETDVGPPLELFGEENQGQSDLVQGHTGQTDNVDTDLSDEARSANDIYEMITGSFEQQTDTEEIDTEEIDTEEIDTEEIDTEEIDTEDIKTEQDIQDSDPGDVMAEEIPLMQTYTRDIESTLE